MGLDIALGVVSAALLVTVVALAWFLVGRRGASQAEGDRVRQYFDEQARGLRLELTNVLGGRLDSGIAAMTKETETIGRRLDAGAQQIREEVSQSFQRTGAEQRETLNQLGQHQRERLENVTTALGALTTRLEQGQGTLRQTVEGRLEAIRNDNAAKLDQMRATVDEKLQSTLETRLGESFTRVVEQLKLVHQGIGEMQSLAAGVSDLKKVLSNVRVRGTFGENQLAALLEQFLSPEQFLRNAQVQEHSLERVDFAVKLPGRDDATGAVLLPIDAKFPREDYDRLLAAAEKDDLAAVEEAGRALEQRIKNFARSIQEKYIHPPRTTDFAILFLPTESLYAEVLRRPGLFETIQRDCHVTLTGPTTFSALLNALQMGFRSLAIEQRSSEVWKLLGAIQAEFGKYDGVVRRLAKQLNTASESVQRLGTRTRVMNRRLRDVEQISQADSTALLDTEFALEAADGSDELDEEAEELPIPASPRLVK